MACCDQLLILDCCYAEKAFTKEHEGKSKFELFTSVGPHDEGAAPGRAGSFTALLNAVLEKLLKENRKGFSTSQLYRELYHSVPATLRERPHLFDMAKNTQERIWLRPLKIAHSSEPDGDIFLNITIRLKVEEDTAEQPENLNVVMNHLAYKLQYLEHVGQISFKYLSAPKARLKEFGRIVLMRQKLIQILDNARVRIKAKALKGALKERIDKGLEKPPANAVIMTLEPTPEQRRKGEINDWSHLEPWTSAARKEWLRWPGDITWRRYMTFGSFSLDYSLSITTRFSIFSIMVLPADKSLDLIICILLVVASLAFLLLCGWMVFMQYLSL